MQDCRLAGCGVKAAWGMHLSFQPTFEALGAEVEVHLLEAVVAQRCAQRPAVGSTAVEVGL